MVYSIKRKAWICDRCKTWVESDNDALVPIHWISIAVRDHSHEIVYRSDRCHGCRGEPFYYKESEKWKF